MAKKIILCILTVACVLWTVFIFSNSLDDGSQSSAKSSEVTAAVNKAASAVGIEKEIKESTVRNMAHFSEFAVLAVLLSATVSAALWQKKSLGISLLYICTSVPVCFVLAGVDELLQKLSPGRVSHFADVLLDTLGAVCGCALFTVGYVAFVCLTKRAKKKK